MRGDWDFVALDEVWCASLEKRATQRLDFAVLWLTTNICSACPWSCSLSLFWGDSRPLVSVEVLYQTTAVEHPGGSVSIELRLFSLGNSPCDQ